MSQNAAALAKVRPIRDDGGGRRIITINTDSLQKTEYGEINGRMHLERWN